MLHEAAPPPQYLQRVEVIVLVVSSIFGAAAAMGALRGCRRGGAFVRRVHIPAEQQDAARVGDHDAVKRHLANEQRPGPRRCNSVSELTGGPCSSSRLHDE